MNFLLLNSYLIDKIEPFAKWITVGLFAIMVIALITLAIIDAVKNKKSQAKNSSLFANSYKKIIISFFFYALVLGLLLLVLELSKKFSDSYLDDKWVNKDVINLVLVPLIITIALTLIVSVVLFILSKKNVGGKKIRVILGVILALSFVVTLVLDAIYFSRHILGDGYYTEDGANFNSTLLYVFAVLLVVLLVVLAFVLGRKNKKPFSSHSIALAGICVSLSFALSFIKLWDMPTGGSVTLVSLLPIMIYAYIYGAKKGLLIGLLYGLLQAVQDPWLIHPAQFMLDYPIAFSCITLAGVVSDTINSASKPYLTFTLGAVASGVFRYVCHVISGMFAFGAYAPSGTTNFFAFSLVYNSYVFIDILLVIVAGFIVFTSKSFVREAQKLSLK